MCVLGRHHGVLKILGGFKPPYTATAVWQMIDAGAIVVANANMDEFAMGSSNETSFYGPVKHPINEERGQAEALAEAQLPLLLASRRLLLALILALFASLHLRHVGMKPPT